MNAYELEDRIQDQARKTSEKFNLLLLGREDMGRQIVRPESDLSNHRNLCEDTDRALDDLRDD